MKKGVSGAGGIWQREKYEWNVSDKREGDESELREVQSCEVQYLETTRWDAEAGCNGFGWS